MLIIIPGIISVGVASGSCLRMRMCIMPMHSDITLQIYSSSTQYVLFEINRLVVLLNGRGISLHNIATSLSAIYYYYYYYCFTCTATV